MVPTLTGDAPGSIQTQNSTLRPGCRSRLASEATPWPGLGVTSGKIYSFVLPVLGSGNIRVLNVVDTVVQPFDVFCVRRNGSSESATYRMVVCVPFVSRTSAPCGHF